MKALLWAALMVWPIGAAWADDELDALMALDLEELTVSVASKRDETIRDAPSVISVITAEEIERFGVNDLFEVIGRFPNVYTASSAVDQDSIVSIRGQTHESLDNHILLLLNGRPMRDSAFGGTNKVIYDNFPLEAIERLEMIRGPGSALYGSNAFSGVLNIITKTASGLASNQATVGYGSWNTRMSSGIAAMEVEESSALIAGRWLSHDGWDVEGNDPGGNAYDTQSPYDGNGIFAQFTHEALSATLFRGRTEDGSISSFFSSLLREQDRDWEFLDVGLEHEWDEQWTSQFNLTHNRFGDQTDGIGGTHNWLLEHNAQGVVSEDLYLTFGGTILSHHTDNPENWYSAYLQADQQVHERLKLIAGLQMNKPEGMDIDFSPRLGGIVTLDQEWSLKLLYSKAFRAPYFNERFSDAPGVLSGNPELIPETIETIDAQLYYERGRTSGGLTLYYSNQKDRITRLFNGTELEYANAPDEVDYYGIELESKHWFNPNWELQGSITYQAGQDAATDNEDFGIIPHFMAKAGLSYLAPEGYVLSLSPQYYSEAASIEETTPGVNVVNPSADGCLWLDANARFPLHRLIEDYPLTPTTVTFYGRNLLNHDVYYPESVFGQVNTIPVRNGAEFYAKVTLEF